jgi:hypothetical protein
VGQREANHLSVRPVRRADPAATGFWDGNWLKAAIAARAGAFSGAFDADLRSDELAQFAEQLAALEGASEGTATLESVEGWVALRLALEPSGRLVGSCEVRDDPAEGSRLRFPLVVERSQRLDLLDALREILRTFPVIGSPEEEASTLLASAGDEDSFDGE